MLAFYACGAFFRANTTVLRENKVLIYALRESKLTLASRNCIAARLKLVCFMHCKRARHSLRTAFCKASFAASRVTTRLACLLRLRGRPGNAVRFLDCARNDRAGESTGCIFPLLLSAVSPLLSFRPKRSFLPNTRAKPWLLRERGAATKRSCKARLRGLLRAQFAATSAWRNLARSAGKRWRLDSSTSPLLKIPCSSLLKGAYTAASRSRRKARRAVKLFTSPASRRRRR